MSALLLLSLIALSSPPADDLNTLMDQARAKDRANEHAAAAQLWDQVIKINPYQGQYWQNQAESLRRAGQFEQAAKAYQEAQRIGSGQKGSLAYSVACCQARAGQTDAALDSPQRALNEGHRNPSSFFTSEDLASLRAYPRFVAMMTPYGPAPTERNEGWRHDLNYYVTELKRRHPDLYRRYSQSEWEKAAKQLHEEIPQLNDTQLETRFIRIAAMAGAGHTHLRPSGSRKIAPLELYQLEEGVAVIAASPEYAEIVGCRLEKVGDHPVESALHAVIPLISWDSPMAFKSMGPRLLTLPRLLYGLGLIPSEEEVSYTFRGPDQKPRQITVKTQAASHTGEVDTSKWIKANQKATQPEPLYLKNRRQAYWFEHLPESNLVFCQYNAVRNFGSEPFAAFCERMFRFIEEKKVDALIVDIRWNGGGNSFLNRPLIEQIIRSPRINQKGKLFVIIGRQTFSAAQNCATDLELHTQATFVGEPTGSSPNSIGESIRVTLPYSKMTGNISDLRWWRGWPMDERVWIPPQIAAPPTLTHILENRDPALEAILTHRTRSHDNPTR